MRAIAERTVEVASLRVRVWEKGDGPSLGFLAGFGGATRWTPFLERLSRDRRVIVPSLPGFVGGGSHEPLTDTASWVAATLDVLEASGLRGADLIGASVGGMLAAEAACFSPGIAKRLVLMAPFGLHDDSEPIADVFACAPGEVGALLCAEPLFHDHYFAPPRGHGADDWSAAMARATDAAARLLWPLPERGLAGRLHRIRVPVLLLWGEEDRVIPASYADRFAGLLGPDARTVVIPNAGHMVELDAAEEAAAAVLDFLR